MKRLLFSLQLGVLCALLSGCGSDKSQPSAAQAPANQPGRPDTKAVEAARIVGYDGKQMRKSVDKALDGMDAHNKAIEDATKNAASSP